MGKQAAKGSWHSFEEFAEMAGFHSGLETLRDKGFIKWTNTATQMHTGGIHGLSYKVEKDAGGNPEISLQHWVHWPGGESGASAQKETKGPFIVLKTETRRTEGGEMEIRPVEAVFNGKGTTDTSEIDHFMHFLQEVAKEMWRNIARNYIPQEKPEDESTKHLSKRQAHRRDDIPNLYEISQLTDFRHEIKLPGKSFNFETSFGAPKPAELPPAYPRDLLYAMLGIEGSILDNNGSDKSFKKSQSIATPGEGGYEGITYEYTPDATGGFKMGCHIWSTDREGVKTSTELYSIGFTPKADNQNLLSLNHIAMLPDDRFAAPDPTDHAGVARAIKAMKFIHMAILQGEMPMVSDILDQHHLKPFLRQPRPPKGGPENPDVLLRVYGANRQAALTERELGIGSNGADLTFDWIEDGKRVRQRISLDYGVTFGDRKKGADTILPNFGRNMRHRDSPIAPDANLFLGLETHEHEDHLRGMAKMVRQGFLTPPMVMNPHTYRVLKRMLADEKADKQYAAEALANCHVVDLNRDIDTKDPFKKRRFEYGQTVIEQYAEEIWSESEQRKKYFPVLDVWTKDQPAAKRHVRIGPAGHSALALMFEVEGVLYTGDYKLDQTLRPDRRTDFDWLAKCKDAAVHIMECTNATKKSPDNPSAATIHENRKAIIKKHPGQRFIVDMIGSNATDIENVCETFGESWQEMGRKNQKYIVFAGAAIQNKYSDLNITEQFKRRLREKYGIIALNINTKTGQRIAQDKANADLLILNTGTQDEVLSVSHRIARGEHPLIKAGRKDVFGRLQGVIPVDNNARKRVQQNNRLRNDFGATVYDFAEEAEKGNHIGSSSHASQNDARDINRRTKNEDGKGLLKILHHGGPAQLDAMMKIMEEDGARAMVPDPQCIYRIDKTNKTVELAAETFEDRLSYLALRKDPDEFFKKPLQQVTEIPLKDRWNGRAAEAMARLERHVQTRLEEKHGHKPTDRGANLSEEFNDVTGLENFPPIGIYHPSIQRPYHKHHKNIELFIAMDSETTGANPDTDLPTSTSFDARNEEGEKIATKTLRHALSSYTVMTPGALLVTKNTTPQKLYRQAGNDNRFSLREYAFNLFNTYRNWPKELTGDKKARALSFGWRNTNFDDPISMRVLGISLAGTDMKPMATYGNLQLDGFNLYSAFLALRPDDIGSKKDKDGNFIRTLETACKTNGIAYENGHDDRYDAEYTSDLFFKMKKIDPNLVEQMIMNCDFSTSRATPMTDHILGQKLHPNGQAPVFGYVDRRDRKCRPHIGALVTIDTEVSNVSDAIVLDLAVADPKTLKSLPDQKLLEVMNDPNGPFGVIGMKKSPMLFPPEFIYRDKKVRRRAVGRVPKSTILQRANELRRMHSDELGRTFAQRVQQLYKKSALYRGNSRKEYEGPANDNKPDLPFRTPAERIFSLFHVIKGVNHTKKLHWAEAGKLVRLLQPKEEEFQDKEKARDLWTHALKKIREISEQATAKEGRKDPYIEDIRFLIEWQADNINPKLLPKEDRIRMNALKSAWLHQSVRNFISEIEKIESDPQMFSKLVGEQPDARERWAQVKETYLAYAESMKRSRKYAMTKQKQEIVNAERRNDPSFGMG